MSYSIVDNNTAVRHIVIDADADLSEINTDRFAAGTTVFSIDDNHTFMLSNAGEWKTIPVATPTAPTSTI